MFGVKYIIRKRQLGDVLWIEPVIRQLAQKNKKIIVHTKFNVLFENFPYKNVVFKNKLNIIERFLNNLESFFNTNFLFVNLERSYEKEPKQHFLHAYQKKANVAITYEYPKIYLTEKEKQFKDDLHDKFVILHIKSFSSRNYRHIYGINWEDIVACLKQRGYQTIQIGKDIDNIEGCINVSTNIRELMGLIYNCSLFIGIDSGPSHIAAALNKKCLIFFGAINPDFRHFRKLFNGCFLQQECEFLGCYHRCPGVIDPPCKIYNDNEIPKCSIYTNEYLIREINLQLDKLQYEKVNK